MSSVAAAAEAAGIPETTVRYWMDRPEFVELRTKTREDGAAGWSVLMHLAQRRLADLIDQMEPRDLIVLGGVAAEKSQLLSGGATARTETHALADGLDDHEKATLRKVIDDALLEVSE